MTLREIVIEELKAIRSSRGLTQQQMADILIMERTSYGKIEKGERGISLDLLEDMATKLDIEPNILLRLHGNNINNENAQASNLSLLGNINSNLTINLPKEVVDILTELVNNKTQN